MSAWAGIPGTPMKSRLILALAVTLAVGACTPKSNAPGQGSSGTHARAAGAPVRPAAHPTSVGATTLHRFANLPDRGALVQYPAQPIVRRDGAYTWHRADLSESHALAAIGGVLEMTSPSGKPLRFRYERHVEHANGDWTWVGSVGNGSLQEAVITFGARAAFGSIGQADGTPLRLTLRDGVAWLVETDPAKIAQINNSATRPDEPDYLVPPSLASQGERGTRPVGSASSTMSTPPALATNATASAASASTTTVDLVLGYTPGFVAYYGGESQALTRLNNMVAITNEAYVNSRVDAQIRLVKAVAVNYADATPNRTALEELTGFQAPRTRTTPAAAFSELRAARDTYGADLVSLVRSFRTPENEGCGIAWLNGGGRTAITQSSEFFGYSVVSDGRDQDTDGKTYFCREETLAHELGHNMGSAHDRDASDGDDNVLQSNEYGAFDYSFGYKTDANNGNFYTVMAYGDSGQTRHRVFSNPRVTQCGGVPCGTEGVADNARSIAQVIATIAGFRAAVVPVVRRVRNDFNGDGKSDIYWRNHSTGSNVVWTMDGVNIAGMTAVYRESGQNWRVLGSGDFNGDGYADVLWRNGATGANHLQLMHGSQVLAGSGTLPAVSDLAWEPVAIADFDADGRSDVLWRNNSTGVNALWIMEGRTLRLSSYVYKEEDAAWKVAGAADFNGDGYADVLWRNVVTGANYLQYMMGTSMLSGSGALPVVADPNWRIVAIADFNGDGRADVYWRNSAHGTNVLWILSGVALSSSETVLVESDAAWKVVNSGDYNGDGYADVLWRHAVNGRNYIHLMRGASVVGGREIDRVGELEWTITGN